VGGAPCRQRIAPEAANPRTEKQRLRFREPANGDGRAYSMAAGLSPCPSRGFYVSWAAATSPSVT
jgi:hypothetical protein